MKKMLIALLLALTLLVSAVPSFAEEAPKELKFVYIDGWSSVDDGDTTSAITQKIAEETGTLDEVMQALSDHYAREDAIMHSIRSAVAYPAVMAGMMIAVIRPHSLP